MSNKDLINMLIKLNQSNHKRITQLEKDLAELKKEMD